MVNVCKLKAAMVEHNYTQEKLAMAIGISPRTLSSKMKRGIFGTDEIEAIMNVLHIKDPCPIFFSQAATK